jgi:hypothetical protein
LIGFLFAAAHRAFIALEIRFRAAALIFFRFFATERLPLTLLKPSNAAIALSKRLRSAFSSATIFSICILLLLGDL